MSGTDHIPRHGGRGVLPPNLRRRAAFPLIELLVAIAIIAVLAASA